MKYFTKKIIAVLLTVMLTGITVLHVSGGQTIKVNAAQTFKVHFIDVGAADGALLQYGEGENAKYALIDSGLILMRQQITIRSMYQTVCTSICWIME